MDKRILVGLSGGTDSTAACILLRDLGYTVLGLTIRNHDLGAADGEEPAYVVEARAVAQSLGIEHHVTDARADFDRDVAAPFAQAWLDGLTPNPCVECNPRFKFRLLAEWADRLGCPYIATGHYAQLVEDGGLMYVTCGKDGLKDQSYFLWKVGQDVLKRTVFPLGGMTKADARAVLQRAGLPVKQGESMEVCFIPTDYRDWLHERFPDLDQRIGPGRFTDTCGRIIGEHKGYPYYTVGQRKGLVVAFGEPRYVLRSNPARNTVVLGTVEDLTATAMLVRDWAFTGGELPSSDGLTVRIRYRSRPVACSLSILEEGLMLVRFAVPVQAVAPGQSAVFYRGDTVLGGATIASQKGLNQYI